MRSHLALLPPPLTLSMTAVFPSKNCPHLSTNQSQRKKTLEWGVDRDSVERAQGFLFSWQSHFFFYQDVQSKYTVHCNVRTLSPVKRRKLRLTSFHSSPLAKPRSFFLYVIILSLWRPYLSPGGELWRYPAETFETYLSLLLTKSHREVPATFIPIICPQASHQNQRIINLRPNQLDLLYNVPRRGYTLSVFLFLPSLGRQPTQTPHVILLNQSQDTSSHWNRISCLFILLVLRF